jgi:uncharacterized protein YbaP (TraB family)
MSSFKIILVFVVLNVTLVAETFNKPFLWEVEKGGKTSYLFGTMHLPSKELSELPMVVKDAIKSCDGVRTEIDMSFMNQLGAAKLMLREDGKSLKNILPKELYHRTEKYLQTISPALNLEPFGQMKIWALSAIVVMLKEQMKNPTLKAIDEIIFTYGKEQNKSVTGIETVEEQVAIFDQFTLTEQILMLESTLEYLEKNKNYSELMKKLYLRGDEKGLVDFANEQLEDKKYEKLEEKFMEILLYNRNQIMANRIDELLKKDIKQSYFFAFGALHFLDKKSVIENLENRGYKVSRVEK